MVTIAAANLLIAVTPTAAAIGFAAGLVLVLSRIVMGISFGGEIPSASAYITETAPPRRRFFYSGIASLGGVIGPILAFITLAILLGTMGTSGVENGGWRIAFVVAAVAGLVALWIRSGVEESHAFTESKAKAKQAVWPLLRTQGRLLAAVFFGCAGGTVAFYLGTVYLPVYADLHGVIEREAAEKMMPVALFVMMGAMLLSGWLADRFGSFAIFRLGYILLAVGTGPLLLLLTAGKLSFLATAVIYLAIFALVLAQANVIFAQVFPTAIRVIGFGIPYTISAAIFGGTTPLVAQSLAAAGHSDRLMGYAAGIAIVSMLATLLVRPADIKVKSEES
jgi:MHS family alpha-ketoglutarate permease-like MFS transporter